jgi:predicted  nucleic acid-binding Zn-ribbon protein
MQKVTVSIADKHEYELRARQHLDALDSRSAAIRTAIEEYSKWKAEYAALQREHSELQKRYADREDRISELEEQLTKRSQIEEKIEALPDRMRASRMTWSDRKEKALNDASPWERVKWKVTGVPEERIEEISSERTQ